MVFSTIALLLVIVALVYKFLTWNYDHWRQRNVPGPKPALFTGNYPNMYKMKRHAIYDLDDIYRKYKSKYDAVGIYLGRTPQLMIVSPELAHRVHVSDFKNFHDNELGNMIDEKSDFIISNNMFTMTGDKWKQRRAEITPGLTMSRNTSSDDNFIEAAKKSFQTIKSVYPVTNQVCKKLNEYIRKHIRIGSNTGFNGRDISLAFTTEMVADCVLGLSAQSFTDNPTPILEKIKNLFDQSWTFVFTFALVSIFPALLRIKKLKLIPQDVENFFVNLMQSAIDARESQLASGQKFERVDFLDYILQMGKKKNLSTRQLTANTMTFLIDGFETTASVLAHTMLFLGRDPKSQQRLREEIEANLNKEGFVDFEKIHELPFLDACVQETIRIFPVLVASNKLCSEPIELPNRNGSNFTVEKGTTIIVPHCCFMKDEDYFPNPNEFQPDRFMEPNAAKSYRDRGVFMPFGDGPRICIGMRFALTQIKAALVEVLTNFDIKINPKTRKDNLMEPFGLGPKLDGGIWLDFEARR